jgi:flagellar basal-body rod modification protein FlgD
MYAAGVGASPELIGTPNQRAMLNPDPTNPVIQDPQAEDSSQQFMKLVIEQLKNQDPMDPMKSEDFTTQLAQINSLQQLVTLNANLTSYMHGGQLAEASAMIGQYVEGLDANNTSVTGIVDSVEVIDGEPSLRIGDQLLLLPQVLRVMNGKDAGGK